jgi:hypothetical protein
VTTIANVDARAASLIAKYDAADGDSSESDSASESTAANAPNEGAVVSGAESASADASEATQQAAAASPEATTTEMEAERLRHQLLEEKLAAVREENRLRRERLEAETAAARRAREEADADRQAAAAERAKYEGLGKKGSIKDTISTLGLDPRETWELMKAEALEAGSPEAVERRLKEHLAARDEAFKKQLEESVAPLKQTIEALQKERDDLARQTFEAQFTNDFQREVARYESIRLEYDDTDLLKLARYLRDNPQEYHTHRKAAGLTPLSRGFTMTDILDVLKATQEKHERERKERESKLRPADTAAASPSAKTVNGTTEKRNAGSALGNDMATSRASSTAAKPRESWNQRVRRLSGG